MLKYKLFKWFAGLVLVFGALSAILGIWVINQRVVQEAQTRVRSDLNGAWAVYESQLGGLETIVKLVGARTPLIEACSAQKWEDKATWNDIQGLMARHQLDFKLDFLSVVNPDGRVVARAGTDSQIGDYHNSEPLVAKALVGVASHGTTVLSREELSRESESLVRRAFLPLQETPYARPAPRETEDRGMVMMAAAPIEKNGKVVGAIYAGVLLNRNQEFVDRIQNIVFGQERYQGTALGTVTCFLSDTRIATTVRLANGNRAIGTRVSKEVADRVLDNGAPWNDRAFVVQDWYLTAYDPIRDNRGTVIGMLYVGTLERPFRDLTHAMIYRYAALVACALLVALLMAMFIAGRLARPLHRLAEGANKMQHGQGFMPVPPDRSCAETECLIRAFNEMASALTEREEELKKTNDQLAGANNSLKALNSQYMETLQFVSHELNSPISSIQNYTFLLRQKLLGGLTEKQENALGVMSANLVRVMEMIRHYLNLARIESGEIQPVPTRLAIRENVIAPILDSLQTDIQARNLRVEDLIGAKVATHSDLNMTRELFENLLSNAVKYSRPGGLITLNCALRDGRVEFTVRNEGEGIPPERQGELFRKFSRIEAGESHKTPRGTGLGLFIARKIVEAHGGVIRVASEVGRWTEFQFSLPLAREATRPMPAREVDEIPAASS